MGSVSYHLCGGLFVFKIMKSFLKILITILIIGGLIVFANYCTKNLFLNTTKVKQNNTQNLDKSKQVSLQEVNSLGYNFYVGQIDSTNNITDDLKNQIIKIAYNAHFPASLLKKIPIVILNNLAITSGQYIIFSGTILPIPDLKAQFLSEGGLYDTYSNGQTIIYINKTNLTQLTEILTHELGHAVGSTLTKEEWSEFYQLRNIPSNTPRLGSNWYLSPNEDFAEVYKNTFTGIKVKTYLGNLKPNYDGVFQVTCLFIKTQDCYRKVMINPQEYSADWAYGTPYISEVGPKTKNFINDVVNRLNIK